MIDRSDDVLRRLPEVVAQVALAKATIYDRMRKGTFPQSVDLGGGVVRWWQSDITLWKSELVQKTSDAA